MPFRPTVIESIGDTPLIKLRAASAATGCTILGKAEFMNPGGSVKDRAALAIIRDAMARGALSPGGVIVEGTAGNTGIGIGMVAAALGFRSVIVIPETQAQEKKDMLRLVGAELVEVPAVPYSQPRQLRASIPAASPRSSPKPSRTARSWANQFDNLANRRGHYETTGPEISARRDGGVDGFVSAVGSGGTLAGVGMALKERDPRIKIALADPYGAALYSYYTRANSRATALRSPRASARAASPPISKARRSISPTEFRRGGAADRLRLVEREGLLLGGSSGVNVAGAIRLARELGPGHTIVTLLCDSGARYASKLFNPTFLRAKKLPVPAWLRAPSVHSSRRSCDDRAAVP